MPMAVSRASSTRRPAASRWLAAATYDRWQMYQEKPRRLPVELPFPHTLNRTIVLHIPEGYIVKNPDDLNMNVVHKQNNIITMGFVSSYTLNDNTITITINETYHEISYPLSQFEEFKKIINASADFNKVTLVLEKK